MTTPGCLLSHGPTKRLFVHARLIQQALWVLSLAFLFARLAGAANPPDGAPPPPGKLVDIGGYKLHIWSMGKPSETPAVVLIHGGGDFSFTWGLVQPQVARFTQVCSFDAAYEAWSEPGPLPRTMKQEAHELQALLRNAGVKPPYVLVGASSGGLRARMFNSEFPDEVAGMVLVDSTDPDTVSGKKVNGKNVNFREREESKGRAVPPPQTIKSSPAPTLPLTAEEQERFDRYTKGMGTPRIYRPHDRLPPELQKLDTWARFHINPLVFKTRNPHQGEEMQKLYEEAQREEPPLGDKPLIVLISGDKARKVGDVKKHTPPADISQEEWNRVIEEKSQQKFAQALWSRNGKYVKLESGHEIHLYQPGWVVEAIQQVVEAARRQTRANSP